MKEKGFPSVEKVENSDTKTITFTGTNFYTDGYTGFASFGGVEASSVTLDSETSATAVW